MVVLVLVADVGQLLDNGDAGALEDFGIAYAGPLEDAGCGVGAGGDHHELAGVDRSEGCVGGGQELRVGQVLRVGLVFDAGRSLVVVEEHLDDLLLNQDMEVGVVATLQFGVQVTMC